MENLEGFLSLLNEFDIKLWVEEDRLRYSAPKGIIDPELLAQLTNRKEEIIQFLNQVDVSTGAFDASESPILPISRTEKLALSFAQQRLWFLDQLEKDHQAATYNMPPLVMQLSGRLDVDAFEQSWAAIIQRHEILRTTFAIESGAPIQIIAEDIALDFPLIELQNVPEEQQSAEIQRITREQAWEPFNLSTGPLFRINLLRLKETEHVFILTMHHIISDGWSIGILVSELATLYNAFVDGKSSPLPPLPIQYADFASWQQQRLTGEYLEHLSRYWREQLAGVPALLELPLDHPRPPIQNFQGKTEYLYLSPELSGQLNELSLESGATLFMTLLTAFATLLSRYTRQDDIAIGSPVANRTHRQIESLIGFFINNLVFRIDLRGNPRFTELLERVKQVALDAYDHQDLPFEKLVEDLNLERDLSHTPLFQVLFVLQNAPMEEIELSGIAINPLPTENINAIYDLILSVEETPQGLECKFRYNTDLFEDATIKRFKGHFESLLAGIVAAPRQTIHQFSLLTETEYRHLQCWNDTAANYPREFCLHQLFEAQVERTPAAVAVAFENRQLTYRELNHKANQLAHYLRDLGVRPETLVGICMERSLEMIIGLYGILKAGGAYVPIDPTYPTERQAFMLEDAQVPILLTQAHLSDRIGQMNTTAKIIALDSEMPNVAQHCSENPATGVHPVDLAYVIYTSGSTGKPKGVMNSHLGICNRLLWMQDAYQLTSADNVMQKTPFSFDVSVWEFFWPLLVGARLVVARPEGHKDSDYLARLIVQQNITTMHFVPSMLQVFVQEPRLEECQSLKRIICSGEALSHELQERLFARLATVDLYNLYGPTEAAVDVTHWTCQRDSQSTKVPIGRPIANIAIHILDAYLQPVPIGIPGELHIGGIGLARGYHNRPELTAEKFIRDPLSDDPDARLYRTGDLARYLPDGNIEYLGRIDNQIKIRGFRIELGEIETVLLQHPMVLEAVVIGQQDATTTRLLAYTVAAPEASLTVSALRQHVQDKLPEYMIPSAFIQLEGLPLSPNGKVDRRALPLPDASRPELETRYMAPQTEPEWLLTELWKEILEIERIGIHDNFFELGGDSIKGAIFINRLQEKLGKVVYVVALFEAPSIVQFIAYLDVHYPEVLDKIGGQSAGASANKRTTRLDEGDLSRFRDPIPPLAFHENDGKNPPAVFVLSPPRSGSTLLRVLLGGHPSIFAPPELELLTFNTLEERLAAFDGRYKFYLEGTLRAIMEIKDCDAEQAEQIMRDCEERQLTTQQFFRLMQSWLGERILVDKTPSYALDAHILKHAERDFDQPLYIHLLRHPYGMINSFEEAKLDQVFFRYPHDFPLRKLAELIWLQSHVNILAFLETIPPSRQYTIAFEELTRRPRQVINGICHFLRLDFHPDMLEPYQEKKHRMTDGPHPESKMMGDVNFHTHQKIDARVAERWRESYTEDFLGDLTWEMAQKLGYDDDRPSVTTSLDIVDEDIRASIPAIPRDGPLPLSFAQQRLWFLDQLEGPSPTYNIPIALRLEGLLERGVLQRTLQALVQRHESLRTYFPTVDGEPTVHIALTPFALQQVDLSLLPPDKQAREVQRQVDADAQCPFDLEQGPLFRARLLHLGDDNHVLLLNMHHIISDGWSIGVLIREWKALYQAFSQRLPSPLPPLAIQYVDFAHWQRQWLQGDVLDRQVGYWKQRLSGAPDLLELPTDHPRPTMQRFEGKNIHFVLPPQLTARLKELSRETGSTLFMTLLSAFAALLYRYTGQTDIVVGSPIANRNHRQTESLIGFFVNTLVLRFHLEGNPTFRNFLVQTQQTALGAYEHQDIPFEQLVEELRPTRSLSYSPLYQVLFVLQNAPMDVVKLPGLNLTPLEPERVMAKFDLSLILEETDQGLAGTVEYNTALFETATIDRFIDHFTILTKAVVGDPRQRIQQVPLLSAAEQDQMLYQWNDTTKAYPQELTIHHLFEAQAKKTPDATALIFGTHQLTYRELNRRANQLAHHLQSLGIGPDELVAIFMDRSVDMLVGLLGILKAGGAYVPLDPTYPIERLKYMLQDSGARILLTQTSLREHLPLPQGETVCLDTDEQLLSAEDRGNPASRVTPANLAYVIYTSGSTGNPKGVMISHRAVANFLNSMRDQPGLDSRDSLLAVTTISFDIAVLELFLPLMVGATIVLADSDMVKDGTSLLDTLVRRKITVMQATPATWRLLLACGWEKTPHLKVLCGGEALPRDLAQRLLNKSKEVWNMYGPTETTVWSTLQRLEYAANADERTAPLGYPIANTQIYILDPAGNPTPVGVLGELHIGGDGLARGYFKRPDLTDERFIPHPWNSTSEARLYKTGDLARYLPDGTIEYLGRMDNQVKLRGFRIELGEIEAALAQYPGILENVVALHTPEGKEPQLVAYLVTEGEARLDYAAVRGFLQQRLPDYMLPAALVYLEAMPLTPNGKINRRILPAPTHPLVGEQLTTPRDTLELQLIQIWEKVLDIRPIGVRDNFFELGGHSLIAVRLMAQIAQQFQKSLPLASLFQGATIEQLADIIRQQTRTDRWSSLIPIRVSQDSEVKNPFFCAAGAGGNVLYFHELARHLDHGGPFYGLQPQGLDGETVPQTRVEDVATGYIQAVQTVQPHGPYLLGGHSFGGLVAFEMAQQLQQKGERVDLLALLDTPAPRFFKATGADWDEARWLMQIANIIGHLLGTDLEITYEQLQSMAPDEQLNYLHGRLKQAEFIPSEADIKHFRGFVDVYKANLRMHYVLAEQPIPTRIALFRSRDAQPEELEGEMARETEADATMGWEPFASGAVDVHVIPGDHLTMMVEPHVEVLAKELGLCIQQSAQSSSTARRE